MMILVAVFFLALGTLNGWGWRGVLERSRRGPRPLGGPVRAFRDDDVDWQEYGTLDEINFAEFQAVTLIPGSFDGRA